MTQTRPRPEGEVVRVSDEFAQSTHVDVGLRMKCICKAVREGVGGGGGGEEGGCSFNKHNISSSVCLSLHPFLAGVSLCE